MPPTPGGDLAPLSASARHAVEVALEQASDPHAETNAVGATLLLRAALAPFCAAGERAAVRLLAELEAVVSADKGEPVSLAGAIYTVRSELARA